MVAPRTKRRRTTPSITERDLVPDLGLAALTVAVVVGLHWLLLKWVVETPPVVLFTAVAAALTSWRGAGPGLLTSVLGTTIGSFLCLEPMDRAALAGQSGALYSAMVVPFGGSLFVCWVIYRLRASHETAEEGQHRRDHALAFVAHELRHPLATIQLAAAMLQRDRSEATRDRAAALISRSATRLTRVVDDLVDITRLQAQAISLRPEPLSLADVLGVVIETARPSIAARQQVLTAEMAPAEELQVAGDPDRLQQVFGNLLSNASRYSPEGAEIAVSAQSHGNEVVVTVRDTGFGIYDHMLERIFEPFVRDAAKTSEGLGIGLALARSLVTRHGGTITADSDGPGRGSTFTVTLPRLAGATPATPAPATRGNRGAAAVLP
jgi:signal transduction histidine kinase